MLSLDSLLSPLELCSKFVKDKFINLQLQLHSIPSPFGQVDQVPIIRENSQMTLFWHYVCRKYRGRNAGGQLLIPLGPQQIHKLVLEILVTFKYSKALKSSWCLCFNADFIKIWIWNILSELMWLRLQLHGPSTYNWSVNLAVRMESCSRPASLAKLRMRRVRDVPDEKVTPNKPVTRRLV